MIIERDIESMGCGASAGGGPIAPPSPSRYKEEKEEAAGVSLECHNCVSQLCVTIVCHNCQSAPLCSSCFQDVFSKGPKVGEHVGALMSQLFVGSRRVAVSQSRLSSCAPG